MFRAIVSLLLLFVSLNAAAIPDIQHWRTKNGARVYFVAAHQIPMVQLSMAFDAGSARDPSGKLGLAHLTNLMLDEGAGSRGGDAIAEQLESVGAEFSSENGRDMSVVELRTLSEREMLDTAIGVFADVVTEPTFPESALAREKERALIRLKQQQQTPQQLVQREFFATLFAGHPYAKPVDGDEAGVQALTRDDLVRFHKRYFAGANAVLVIVGDLSRTDAERVAKRVIGALPRGEAAPKIAAVSDPSRASEKRIEFPSQQSHILIGQPGVSRKDPDYYSLYLGNHILGGSGLVSRLSVEIREKRGLAYSVYSYFVPMRQRGPYIIGLQTRNDQSIYASQLARETVERFVSDGPTEAELDAAKKNITGGFPLNLDSNRKIAGSLLNIAFYELPLDYLQTYTKKIEELTTKQVRDAFRRRVDPKRLVHVVVGGQNA